MTHDLVSLPVVLLRQSLCLQAAIQTFIDPNFVEVYNAGLCAGCPRPVFSETSRTMTAKKTTKPASSRKQTTANSKAATGKSGGGLLSKLRGALNKPKASSTAAAAKSAKKAPVKKSAAASKPSGKASVKAPAKTAAKSVSTKVAPAKTSSGKTSASKSATPAVQRSGTTPVKQAKAATSSRPTTEQKHVTKAAVKSPRSKAPSVNGALTEDELRRMSDDDYMNETQMEFFRKRLLQMREEVLQREVDVKERLHEREVFADPADRATAEEEHWLDLRLRERESLLLRKVDDALRRIENKEYGYCEKTGDPIGIPRLLARPTATVCVDVKGQDERVEAQYRDR
jgi:DnaK suppressor protein